MKQLLRSEMLEKRNSLTSDECLINSEIIIEKVIKLLKESDAKNILIYMDMQNEVMATLLLDYNFNVYITKTMPDNTLKINKYLKKELVKHKFGYYQSSSKDYIDGNIIDSVIVPGVAFDKHGNRVGFGKGYYDRLLDSYPKMKKIAICHDFQITEKTIETNEFDKKMDVIITEKRIIEINKSKH